VSPRQSGARRTTLAAALALGLFSASAVAIDVQSYAGLCVPLNPPELPSDAELVREFAELLREEFEQYLIEVTTCFQWIDAKRDRAWREAAEVTAQYGALLEALRRMPP